MIQDILLVLVGIVVGGMNAIAGGGMLIGFPVLIAVGGLPPLLANATGNIVTMPGQLTSALGYRNYLRKVPLRYILLLIPCVIGAALGSLTLRSTSQAHFAKLIPLLVLFGVILFAFQPLLHFHLHRSLTGRRRKIVAFAILGLSFLPLSFYGGYFGAGYGFIMLAFLGMTNLRDAHMINGMKNVSAIFVSGTSIVCLYGAHLIHWRQGLFMAAGSMIGGYAGARGAQKVSSHWLRVFIIIVGIGAVIYLAFRDY